MGKSLTFSQNGWNEYLSWQNQDKKTLKRVNQLLQDIMRNPFDGIGKPEALKEDNAGYWSRRIDEKNRIMYRVKDGQIDIAPCRSHYDD